MLWQGIYRVIVGLSALWGGEAACLHVYAWLWDIIGYAGFSCTDISTNENASYLLEDIKFCDKKDIRKAHITWGSKPVRKCVIFSCSKVYPSVQPSTAVLLYLCGWIGHLISTSETPHVHTKTSQVQTKHQRWNNCLPRRIFRTSPTENPFILKNTGKDLPIKTGGEPFGLQVWKLKQLQD